MAKSDPAWRRFEKVMQQIFSRNENAKVIADAEVKGRSGRTRKLEMLVEYPFTIPFGDAFEAHVPIKIAVDCKHHKRAIDINLVDQFYGQMDDIGAHVGIMVATSGFDKGAEAEAKAKNIFLVNATWDLIQLAKGLEEPEFHICQACVDSEGDHMGVVEWENPPRLGDMEFWPAMLRGACHRCDTQHTFCPDCGAVTGLLEGDEDECIECSGGCGRVYMLSYDGRHAVHRLSSLDHLGRSILEAAWKNGGKLSETQLHAIVKQTKWQYCTEPSAITDGLDGEGYIEWRDIDDDHSELVLTECGQEFCDERLSKVRSSHYGW